MLEALLEGMERRVPDIEFTLLSMYPAEDRRLNVRSNLEIVAASPVKLGVVINSLALAHRLLPPLRGVLRRWSRSIAVLADAKALVDQGGITFSDGREKFLLYNVASVLPGINTATPVFKCAQAIGPFRRRLNRLVSKWVLPKMHMIVTRGQQSRAHAQDLGLQNAVPGADLALTLHRRPATEINIAAHLDPTALREHGTIIGLSPSAVVEKAFRRRGRDYVEYVRDVVDALAARGFTVVLIPHSARPTTQQSHNNDLPLCRRIMRRVASDSSVWLVDGDPSALVLRSIISHCDVFVASRFHAMVSALAEGVPTLVLGWSHKYREVLAQFGLEEWARDAVELDVRDLVASVGHLLDSSEDVRKTMAARRPSVVELAEEQLEALTSLVRGRSPDGGLR